MLAAASAGVTARGETRGRARAHSAPGRLGSWQHRWHEIVGAQERGPELPERAGGRGREDTKRSPQAEG